MGIYGGENVDDSQPGERYNQAVKYLKGANHHEDQNEQVEDQNRGGGDCHVLYTALTYVV